MNARRPLLVRAALVVALTVGLFLLCELYLRREITYVVQRELADQRGLIDANPEFLVIPTDRGRKLVPGADVVIKNHFLSHRDIAIKVNSLGFRGPELPRPKPADEQRILFLGDSVTIADSVAFEETFVERIQQQLRVNHPHLQAINGGVGNTGIEEYLNRLREPAVEAQPDIVVLVYYLNDSRPPWGFSGEIGDRGWLRRHSLLLDLLYRNIALWVWNYREPRPQFEWLSLQDKLPWREDDGAFRQLISAARFDWGAAWTDDGRAAAHQGLLEFAKLGEQFGYRAAVVAMPVSFQVERSDLDDTPQRALRESTAGLGLPYFDLLPALRNHHGEDLFFDQCHLTPHGHEIVAATLRPFIEALLGNEKIPEHSGTSTSQPSAAEGASNPVENIIDETESPAHGSFGDLSSEQSGSRP